MIFSLVINKSSKIQQRRRTKQRQGSFAESLHDTLQYLAFLALKTFLSNPGCFFLWISTSRHALRPTPFLLHWVLKNSPPPPYNPVWNCASLSLILDSKTARKDVATMVSAEDALPHHRLPKQVSRLFNETLKDRRTNLFSEMVLF